MSFTIEVEEATPEPLLPGPELLRFARKFPDDVFIEIIDHAMVAAFLPSRHPPWGQKGLSNVALTCTLFARRVRRYRFFKVAELRSRQSTNPLVLLHGLLQASPPVVDTVRVFDFNGSTSGRGMRAREDVETLFRVVRMLRRLEVLRLCNVSNSLDNRTPPGAVLEFPPTLREIYVRDVYFMWDSQAVNPADYGFYADTEGRDTPALSNTDAPAALSLQTLVVPAGKSAVVGHLYRALAQASTTPRLASLECTWGMKPWTDIHALSNLLAAVSTTLTHLVVHIPPSFEISRVTMDKGASCFRAIRSRDIQYFYLPQLSTQSSRPWLSQSGTSTLCKFSRCM